jgi:hypothetical protein
MYRCVVTFKLTDVSEVLAASIIRATMEAVRRRMIFIALMMVAERTSETPVNLNVTT